ncbi:MAG: RNA polymerase sigma factor region1.1 domain-containing protein, partial [Deltaproteobacteria bacterium]|nr:RNA polymerase sigma factor region1.1 domain-containing protein [Deltaproteobacteria bacterium]
MAKKNNGNNVTQASGASSGNHDLLSLIDIGKDKGFLTYDEINDAFPEDNFSVEEMDNLLGTLGELGIDIVDTAEKGAEAQEAA